MDLSQMGKTASERVLVAIGGLDPGAGAGLGRDLLTARALGAGVRLVGSAFTEQSAERVVSVEPRAPDAFEAAVRQSLRAPTPQAVKVGMIPGPAHAAALVRALAEFDGPIVVDPVLKASSGGALWVGSMVDLMPLLRRATLVTPNVPEAEALTGRTIGGVANARAAALELRAAGLAAVLLKGGHLRRAVETAAPAGGAAEDEVVDLLFTGDGEHRFSRTRIPGPSPRGTGCALATALAIHLGEGLSLKEAVERATGWLAARIAGAIDVAGERQLG